LIYPSHYYSFNSKNVIERNSSNCPKDQRHVWSAAGQVSRRSRTDWKYRWALYKVQKP